jgi:hypothetical protein
MNWTEADRTEQLKQRVAEEALNVEYQRGRTSFLLRPRLFVDGNQWCALYGENVQDGVAGFGDSPADAFLDFDRAWETSLSARRGGQ